MCSGALQTLGGYGYLEEFGLAKIYRDVRVCRDLRRHVRHPAPGDRPRAQGVRQLNQRSGKPSNT